MDFQVTIPCGQLAEWHAQLQNLADILYGQPAGEPLSDIAQQVYESVPAAWWATQPQPAHG